MVTMVQAISKPPLDGLLGRSLSSEPGTSSFGEILKLETRKEKEEVEKSASSAAAAMLGVPRAVLAEPQFKADENGSPQDSGAASIQANASTQEAMQTYSDSASSKNSSDVQDSGSLAPVLPGDQSTGKPSTGEGALPAGQVADVPQVLVPDTTDPKQQGAVTVPFAVAISVDVENMQIGTPVSAETLNVGVVQSVDTNGLQIAAATQAVGANLQTGLSQAADSVEAQAANGTTVNNAGTVVAQPVPIVVAVSNTAEAQAVLDGTKQDASVGATEKKSSAELQPALNLATNAQLPAANPLKAALDVKVTVPSTGLPENIQPADVVQQIMRQMNARLQSEPTSMHLQLNPKELGFIDVQMVRSAQGVSVSFITEQASTGRLLETQINNLRQSLTDSGIQLSSVNINPQGQPGQQGSSFRQTPLFTQYANRVAVESETRAEIASKLQTNQGTGLQMVDYRV